MELAIPEHEAVAIVRAECENPDVLLRAYRDAQWRLPFNPVAWLRQAGDAARRSARARAWAASALSIALKPEHPCFDDLRKYYEEALAKST